jgi:hypothetical protein
MDAGKALRGLACQMEQSIHTLGQSRSIEQFFLIIASPETITCIEKEIDVAAI